MNKPFTNVDIIRTVRLLKAANCTEWATLAETARELGIQKTRLMEYIEDHPKLFILEKSKILKKKKKNERTRIGNPP